MKLAAETLGDEIREVAINIPCELRCLSMNVKAWDSNRLQGEKDKI